MQLTLNWKSLQCWFLLIFYLRHVIASLYLDSFSSRFPCFSHSGNLNFRCLVISTLHKWSDDRNRENGRLNMWFSRHQSVQENRDKGLWCGPETCIWISLSWKFVKRLCFDADTRHCRFKYTWSMLSFASPINLPLLLHNERGNSCLKINSYD